MIASINIHTNSEACIHIHVLRTHRHVDEIPVIHFSGMLFIHLPYKHVFKLFVFVFLLDVCIHKPGSISICIHVCLHLNTDLFHNLHACPLHDAMCSCLRQIYRV